MFSITWNNSFTDSLNDLLTALSAVGNLNGQLCHGCRRPEDRSRAQVCIQACSKGQERGAVLQEKRRFYHKPPFSGLDGSRTRVRNTIPCPSTSVVYYLTFPLPHDNKQPCSFSSFMIRPMAQSFANVVSHIVEAWVLKCECSRSDCCH